MIRQYQKCRSAFTLVEMLVSTALIIFVMVILTQVFGYGLQSLRNLRGVGSLQEQLRYASNILRRDLSAQHFGRESSPLNGPYVSQQRMDQYDWTPPREGFFRILQGSVPTFEGTDGDGIASYRATDHSLHFTVRMDMGAGQGTGRERLFKTRQIPAQWMSGLNVSGKNYIPPSEMGYLSQDPEYCSRWAEVAYFLDASGQQTNGSNLYTLYRRQRIALDSRLPNNERDFRVGVTLPPDQQNPLYSGWRPTTAPIVPPGDPNQSAGELRSSVSTYAHPINTMPSSAADKRFYLNTPADLANPLRRLINGNLFYQSQAMRKALMVQQGLLPVGGPDPVRDYALVNLMPPPPEVQFMPLYKSTLWNPVNQQNFRQENGGDDILLENVLSMEIRVNWDVPTDSRMQNVLVRGPRTGLQYDEPFDLLPPLWQPLPPDSTTAAAPAMPAGSNLMFANPLGPAVFDTWCGSNNYQWLGSSPSPMNIPLRIRVKAIQIRLRVWDIKTQQARQVTIIQDL